jgi:hypothetical protein
MNARRLYRLLLLVYPEPFRQRYGDEMTDTFVDLHQYDESTGLRFWSFVVSDTVRAAAVQHLQVWASEDGRVAGRWLLSCVVGTVLCNLMGGGLMWAFQYFYHPFLEGTTFSPFLYGALLGATLGGTQSLMFARVSERATWILVSALSAAVGWKFATEAAGAIGLLGYGVVIGVTVASTQRLALRGRMHCPSAAAVISAFAVSTAAVAGSVAVTRTLAGLNALGVPQGTAPITIELVLRDFFAPMDWRQSVFALTTTAVAGLVLGAITVRPASSLLARAH